MFKLTEYSNASYSKLAIGLRSTGGEGPDVIPCNTLHLAIWKYSWWFRVPHILKSKEKWVDLTTANWATVRSDGRKGYTEIIPREFGFSVLEDAIHVQYGIQPGSWSSTDKENSDHTKVFFYFWNFDHVRHSCYFTDGTYASNGQHFSSWQETQSLPYNKATKEAAFRTVKSFEYPIVDVPQRHAFGQASRSNFSGKCTNKPVYKFYEYIDRYDGTSISTKVNIEEREWIRGKWAWMKFVMKFIPGCRKIRRTIDIEFADEAGSRKGSWKGGTIGMGFNMLPNETIDQCWQRFIVSDERP